MKLYCEEERYTLYYGSMLDMLDVLKPNSVDAIVTDPPYELNFMGKGWDNSGVSFQKETWEKCFDVLKPGGYLLSFGGSRTYHRIACAIEDAGFEIRDCIQWLFGSGFPKSMNIGLAIDKKQGVESKVIGQNQDILKKQAKDIREGHRKISDSYDAGAPDRNNGFKTVSADIKQAQNEWDGWGTQIKPAYEPIIVARKPCEGSVINNVLKWGVGGINIDECRIGTEQRTYKGMSAHKPEGAGCFRDDDWQPKDINVTVNGRFPSNVILTYDETDYDEVCGGFPDSGSGNGGEPYNYAGRVYDNKDTSMFNGDKPQANSNYNDFGSASRYFYCAKASRKDRDDGLERFNLINNHSTVKPCTLMQYLIRLVTPKGGVVLDPFNGSGSTGKALMWENKERSAGYKYIGIELNEDYLEISKARIEYAVNTEKIQEEIYKEERKKIIPGKALDMFAEDD